MISYDDLPNRLLSTPPCQNQNRNHFEYINNKQQEDIFFLHCLHTQKISLHWYTKMSMKVSIPQGAQPGSVFQVQQPDGQIISIQVPPGN